MNTHYLVAVSGTPLPALTYGSDLMLAAGTRVLVPLGQRQLVGVVLAAIEAPTDAEYAVKSIISALDDAPLWQESELKLLAWCARYYHADWGRLLETALPPQLRLSKQPTRPAKQLKAPELGQAALVNLNAEQQHASDKIAESFGDFKAWLLMGVTGSGKTEVYAQLINQVLQQQKQVLMLVPEIGLTAPMVSRLAQRLNTEPVLLHSERTNSQRAQVWQLTRQGHPLLLIGTRSAIFAPLPKLGLIIVDEEHDSAYKQQDSIRYHARDVALMRAKQQVCPIVLGSATPSLESLANVDQGKLHLLTLTQRANQQTLPTMLTIDMRQQKLDGALSPQLLSAVERTLAEQGQVLLFLNRRGYSPVLMCHDCGHTLDCPACEVPYTFHRHAPNLRCHHCGKVEQAPAQCPSCGSSHWHLVGQGTQKVEEALQQHFPNTPVLRVDRDSTQGKDKLNNLFAQIRAGDPCIILGTQMLAKGHDFAGIALVGIIDVDSALFARDFRSLERLAQLVIQVSGRAGRGSQAGQVLLQTHQPHHDFVQSLLTKPYAEIAQQLLKERSDTQLPPFSFSAWLLAEGKHLDRVQAQLEKLLPLCQHTKVQVAGPMPALMHKRQYHYRELLWLQSEQRADLHATIDNLLAFLQQPEGKVTGVRVFLDVDPQDMP
ncbi:MAG: primosomal protein N' [Thiotrichales bacterium 12-47-6]|nr:MAG: primosomal protein N' [Thiotrichales bacterium 12-47-6]